MKHLLLGLLLVGAIGLTGCSSTGNTTSEEEAVKPELLVVEEEKLDEAETAGASQAAAENLVRFDQQEKTQAYTGHPLDNPASPLIRKTVYFDFDKSEILDEGKITLNAHADYLVQNPGARLRIEGHCDERGTREYNVALGERRATAIKRYLTLKGVSVNQLSLVSYGEERPAKMGHDEQAWALNRRGELVYTIRN